jgi:hypothetical protein
MIFSTVHLDGHAINATHHIIFLTINKLLISTFSQFYMYFSLKQRGYRWCVRLCKAASGRGRDKTALVDSAWCGTVQLRPRMGNRQRRLFWDVPLSLRRQILRDGGSMWNWGWIYQMQHTTYMQMNHKNIAETIQATTTVGSHLLLAKPNAHHDLCHTHVYLAKSFPLSLVHPYQPYIYLPFFQPNLSKTCFKGNQQTGLPYSNSKSLSIFPYR